MILIVDLIHVQFLNVGYENGRKKLEGSHGIIPKTVNVWFKDKKLVGE